ncbi:MAG: cobyric acid synthase [Candidatus Omnitrophota bacterium]
MQGTKAIQICGTGSGVGKSVLVSALCRIFLQDGYQVAPFKAQNMALNSFVTADGGEIGRAQATQALACHIKPTVDMNPILIKPASHTSAQIILQGKPVKNMSVYEYKKYKQTAFSRVKQSFNRLKKDYELLVIEGAGSPAEINLKSHDIVNLKIARLAQAPVILVGDIDKGGVFAWLIGTLELLTEKEKEMVKGFIINKFRGDKRLLAPGIRFLEKYTGKKVFGVIPYYRDINIPEEDSLSEEAEKAACPSAEKIDIGVIYLPHISNFNDFDALAQEPDVGLRYIRGRADLHAPDVLIIPGTKNTMEDLAYLKKSGLAAGITAFFASQPRSILVGICGGYQMLGEAVYDGSHLESRHAGIKGLGILPVITQLRQEKILSQVQAKDLSSDTAVSGYEIHHGRSRVTRALQPVFEITRFKNERAKRTDGVMLENQRCWGTYIHGIFDNDAFRRNFLNKLRTNKGWALLEKGAVYDVDEEIEKISLLVRQNLDMDLLYKILNQKT